MGRENLVDQVVSALTQAILSGQLAPGAHLSESTIARDMGLSRAPVREAARLMESTGLVVSHPNRGFFVRKVTADALETLYELRMSIEVSAITRIVRIGARDVVPLLEAQTAQMENLTGPDDTAAHIDADMQFHRLICAHCGNDRFLAVSDQIANELRLCVMLIGHLYSDAHQIALTHAPIVAALATEDAEAARAAMEHHLGDAQARVVALFREIEAKQTP